MTRLGRYLEHAASPAPSSPREGGRLDETAEPHTPNPDDDPVHSETTDELREMELAALRERVVRSEYEVNSQAVADAILARLLIERPAPAEPGG